MTSVGDESGNERRREFRRMVGWSVGAHLFLVGMAVVSPRPSGRIDPSQVVSVDLVAIPAPASRSAAPPPKAAPPEPAKPAEVKPPPPEPPKPKEVVLPKNPERDPSKPKPKPKPEVKQPEPEPDKNLEDLLADMRQDAGEAPPTEAPPAPQETAAASPSPTSGGTIAVSPEELAWIRKAKAHVRGVWVLPPGFRREALETHVVVELDASGAVIGEPRITKRSGNPWYDEGVVRGIQKASPLPPPPNAGEWDFVFLPEDAL